MKLCLDGLVWKYTLGSADAAILVDNFPRSFSDVFGFTLPGSLDLVVQGAGQDQINFVSDNHVYSYR